MNDDDFLREELFGLLLEDEGLDPETSPVVEPQPQSQPRRAEAPSSLVCVTRRFEAHAASAPLAIAVTLGERSWTYRELNSRANQLARVLQTRGIGPDRPVGICLDRSLEMVVAILGVLKAGGAYLPLDPGYPDERLAFMIDDAGVSLLLTDSARLAGQPRGRVEAIRLDADWPEIAGESGADLEYCPASDDLAYLIYTSGSTGRPKGVMITHANLARLLDATDPWFHFGPRDSWTLFHSFAFDFSVWEIWGALAFGGRLVIVPYLVSRSPEKFHALLRDEGVTVLNQTPSAFRQLIRADEEAGTSSGDLALRLIIFGGEALELQSLRPWFDRHSDQRPRLVNMYGITETTVHATYRPVTVADLDAMSGGSPIGRPIPNLQLYLLDQNREPVPIGESGEIYVGGAGVARGYLNRPSLTAERFLPDHLGGEPGARLYRSGDLARHRPDGDLEYLGRVDDQVKIRGHRVELGEIEAAIARHPAIREAVVVARQETPDDLRLIAYVVGAHGQAPPIAELRGRLKEELPQYMVPAAIVVLDALPLTANGKVDREALPALEGNEPAPEDDPLREALFGLLLDDESLDLAPSDEIVHRAGRAEAPLSSGQARLWFLDRLDGPSAHYNMPGILRLVGTLDLDALRRGLRAIRDRHDVLRTRFVTRDDEPLQVIDPPADLEVPVLDLSEFDADSRPAEFARIVAEEASRPFDLAAGPLLRASLVRLGHGEHALLFTMHHIISDGWSIGVLIRELVAHYRAFRSGDTPDLPALPFQYSDYVEWHHTRLTPESLRPKLDYWRNRLAGAPEILNLPWDRPRPAVQTYGGRLLRFQIGPEISARLKGLARQSDSTLFMVLQAGFAALLSRYSGSTDIVVGTPVANRDRPGLDRLIGLFVNTLVLRTDVSGDPTFAELIARVRNSSLQDLAHQDFPFDRLVDELRPRRSLGHSPLFQVMLALQNTPMQAADLPGLAVSIEEPGSLVSKFDLTVTLTEVVGGLDGEIEYNTDLFESETARRVGDHFRNLLDFASRHPQTPVTRAEILTEAERTLLIETWNANATDFPSDRCIHELFEEEAACTPDAIAIEFADRQLSYAELNARSNQLARHLRTLGVGPEVAVPVVFERSIELIVAFLGVLKAGGAYVPLDPKYPTDRLSYMFGEVQGPVVLTHEQCLGRIPPGPNSVLRLDADWGRIAREDTSNLDHQTVPGNLANVIFTSGSTGRPKGVRVVHDGVVRLVRNTNYADLSADEVILQLTPISFDVSTFEIWGSLLNGGRLVIPPPETPSSEELGRIIRDRGITTMWLTAGHFHVMVDENLEGLRPLRQLIAGGDVLSVPHCRRVLRELPDCRLINGYGPTECTVFTACCTITEDCLGRSVSIGRPVANTKVYILDPWHQPVPLGCPGELCVGGVGLARDYLNDLDLTAERFIADPFSDQPGSRLYRTGDLVRYQADGKIELFGRIDRQVKVRGFRIELGEIEAVLASHDALRDCSVTTRPDPLGNKRLVAYIVPANPGMVPGEDELREHLTRSLPDYMMPAAFVALDALPLNPSGKVDRDALPEPAAFHDPGEGVAPRSTVEQALAAIWAGLLDVERAGVFDNFFELGGHSLMAIRLISRVRDAFGVEFPVRQVFETPTIAGLAEIIADRRGDGGVGLPLPPLRRASREGALPLSFAQQRLWFLDQLDPGGAAYHIPIALRMVGLLRVDLLRRCLDEIVRRHEALRTNFVARDGLVDQVIHDDCPIPLEIEDLSSLPLLDRDQRLRGRIDHESIRPFDLESGALIRAVLLRLSSDEHVLILTMHHVVSDGWSLGILVEEVSALYRALGEGRLSPLADLPIQYADYATWQRSWLEGELSRPQADYWRGQLAGAPKLLELPIDRPRPPIQTFPGRAHIFEIEPALAGRLHDLSREAGASLFMTLLAAYACLLSRTSGQNDIVLGSPVANRERVETEGLIGFFVNTLALRLDLSGDPTYRTLLGRARQVALDAFAHQDLPFERLVDELSPGRSLSHPPIIQALFVLQNAPIRELELPDLALTILEQTSRVAKFDLTLTVEEADGGIKGEFEYNTDLFDRETIVRLEHRYVRLLGEAVDRPDEPVSKLNLLAAAERQRILTRWARGEIVEVGAISISRRFEAQAARTPSITAVIVGQRSWTYRELNAQANQLARVLRSRGVGPNRPVGICLDRSFEMVAAILGVLKAGGAYVPLDPTYPDDRLGFMIGDSGLGVLLTNSAWLAEHPQTGTESIRLDADWPRIAEELDGDLDHSPAPDHLAYLIYTSGSTGQPKGVMVPHRALANHMAWMLGEFAVTAADRVFQKTPFSFDASVWEFHLPLLAGGTLVMAEPGGHQDARYLVDAIRRQGVTIFQGVPTLLAMLAEEEGFADLRTLRLIFSGGEALSARLRDRLWALPDVEVVNLYGPTEACIDATFHTCARSEDHSPTVPIGRPIWNATALVLDEHRQPTPVGIPGELYLGGELLARGYWNRPSLTAETFVEDSIDGGRLYRTGDRVRLRPDGDLEFLGRRDDQVKLRGFRIELGEIESALREHPTVRASAVVIAGINPDDQGLAAFVQAAEGQEVDVPTLQAWLKGRLPEYMVPSAWAIVESLPILPNGKIDRNSLPIGNAIGGHSGATQTPKTVTEELLATLWASVLKRDRIGRFDNFFELGGHSLLATQLVSRLRDVFALEVPLRSVFEAPTIAEFARIIDASVRSRADLGPLPKIEPTPRDVEISLSFAQERLWFLDQIEAGNPFFNMPTALELVGRLDVLALTRALNEVVRRHESLRTRFGGVEGRAIQVIANRGEVPIEFIDLSDLGMSEQEEDVRRRADEEALRPFDLARDLPIRAVLLRLVEERHVFLLTLHHIASDGWSMGILVEEFTRLYTAFAAGLPSTLADLPIQYADFAIWQRTYLRDQVQDVQLNYWKRQLADAPFVLDFPADRRRPTVHTFRGGQALFRLDPEFSAKLRALGRDSGGTLFMTLLAGFSAILSRYTGQEDLLVGTPIANRNREEIEPLIGFFVNTLVLRADLADDPDFLTLLGRVRQTTLDAYAHQDLPFEQLVEELNPDRDMGRNPLVQVTFALQNAPMPPLELEGLTLKSLDLDARTVRFDLEFHVWEEAGGLEGYLLYYSDVFDADAMARLLEHYKNLLRSAVARPDLPISKLPLLSEADRRDLAKSRAAGPVMPYPGRCVHHLFEEQARRTPDAIAVLIPHAADLSLTFADLNARANQLAHHLRRQGAGPDVLVGLCVERSAAMIVGLLGILKAGAAYLPLDPEYPRNRLDFMMEDSKAPILVTERRHRSTFGAVPACVLELDVDSEAIAAQPDHNPDPGVSLDNLAYTIYTSGSTGRPKGVMVPHRALTNHMAWMLGEFAVTAADRVFQKTPFSFDASVWEFHLPLLAGGTLVMAEPGGHQDADYLARAIRRQGVTIFQGVPTLLAMLAEAEGFETLDTLRLIFSGGEALSSNLRDRLWALPDVDVVNLYGPTEACIDATFHACSRAEDHGSSVPIGRPIWNATAYLLDRHRQPVPFGAPGELYIGGDGVGRGYLNLDDRTSERFLPDPFADHPAGRIYRTGDLVRSRADGTLEFLERLDSQVKLRGYRIELGEIEVAIQDHPAVEGAVVLVREDQVGDQRLVAYLKVGSTGKPTGSEAGGARLLADQWQQVFETRYDQGTEAADLDFDITGWDSSYTGEPIPADQMRHWVDTTVGRILGLNPQAVLEIGCGTGLLLSRIAPHCEVYCGSDFSEAAIEQVTRLKQELPALDRVTLRLGAADDFHGIAPGSFDLIVLNSVAQYFPDLDYFLRAFDGAVEAVRPGGHLFLGDLRSFPLLRAYHASVQLALATDDLTAAQLRQRIATRLAQESELLFDPRLFSALKARSSKIRDVRVLAKRGSYRNELTLFRYDVVVRLGDEVDEEARILWSDWRESRPSLDEIRQTLEGECPETLALSGVANARLESEQRVLAWLESAGDDDAVGSLRPRLAEPSDALDPEDLFALGESLGYQVHVGWESADPAGRFDVVFDRSERKRLIEPAHPRAFEPIHTYANNPYRRDLFLDLIPELRRTLQDRLPAYMVPSAFVMVDEFPRTASGKLDRRALKAPDAASRPASREVVEPRTPVERTLADIWAHVLGLERVGVQDNFFELGGDSILSIQIISRAGREGIKLSPRQIFQHQTIEELAAVAGESRPAEVLEVEDGEVPLTPIQRWFFEVDQPEPHHYNQAIVLETSTGLDPALLERAFLQIPNHHRDLRRRFSQVDGPWRQVYAEDDNSATFDLVDWSDQTPQERAETFRQTADRLQASLDLSNGPLVRAAFFRGEESESGRFLWIIHHLLVDGVSWRILIEDLETAYQQLAEARPIDLSPSTSFRRWAVGLEEYANSPSLLAEVDYWRDALAIECPLLPSDEIGSNAGVADPATLAFLLTPEDTEALLHEVPSVYHTQINDVLLTCLVRAFSRWTGRKTLRIDLEGHGREDVSPGLDLGRSIGWFTTLFPVSLDLGDAESMGDAIKSVKEQLRRIPANGIGFGLLRYLSKDEGVREDLARSPRSQVAFNYLGQLDRAFGASGWFRPAQESSGRSISPNYRRRHDLEINASIIEGRLLVEWSFSAERFGSSTVEQLGHRYLVEIRAFLEHCRSPEAGGFTPSDFSAARVGQKNLDRLMAKLREKK